jgi:hypothetical protein
MPRRLLSRSRLNRILPMKAPDITTLTEKCFEISSNPTAKVQVLGKSQKMTRNFLLRVL